jgi:4-amino-4-deoxy-L-arabinose transferase-like glycosyltransferase
MSLRRFSIPARTEHPARTILLVLTVLWLLLYSSFTLFSPPLLDDADSVHSEVAREMTLRHDWITLHANGIRYLEKAPLMYWGMALSFRVFGSRDWAARLPLALFALALFLITYAAGRRLFGSHAAGFYAALILLTSFGIFIYTRIMIPDVVVCLWLTLALFLFWSSLEQERPSLATAWGFALACALGVLTKGLIGVVFPLAVVVLFLFVTRNLGHLRRWHPVSSLLVFLAVALPWHIAAGIRNPSQGHPVGLTPTAGNVHGFFWFYFINEQYLRYLNERVPRDYDTVPLALFWGLLVVFLIPWIAYLWLALGRVPWRRMIARAPLATSDQARSLLVLWAAFVLLFFSFSTRQEYYSLPALPPLALLIGAWLAEEESSPPGDRKRIAAFRVALGLAILGCAGAAAAAFFALGAKPPAPGADLSTLLSQNPGDYALSLGHFLDLRSQAMSAFRVPLLITAAALSGGTLANLLLRRRGHARLANGGLAAMMVLFLLAAHIALVTFSPILSSKALADAIRPRLSPGDIVEIDGEYEDGSTLGFYLARQVRILNGRSSNLWYGSFFSDAPPIFDDDTSFRRLWSGPTRVFLWTDPEKNLALPGRVCIVAKSGGKEILGNFDCLR